MHRKEQIERVRKIAENGDCDISCVDCPLHKGEGDELTCWLDTTRAVTRLIAKGWLAENDHKAPQLQPIETAPKDGSDILLFKVVDECVMSIGKCFYSVEAGRFIAYSPPPFLLYEATHWLPMPEVPK